MVNQNYLKVEQMKNLLLVFFGSGLGGVCRYGLARWLDGPGAFPWGILLANGLACLLVGLALGLADQRPGLGPAGKLLLATGFCGGFSTFSALAADTLLLARQPQWGLALLNLGASLVLGFLAVAAGLALAQRWGG